MAISDIIKLARSKTASPLVRLTNDKTYPRTSSPNVPLVRLTNDRTRGTRGLSATPTSPDVWLEPGYGFGWNTPARLAALDAAYGGGSGGRAPAAAAPAVSATLPPLHEIKWKEGDFDIPGGRAPDWWRNLIPEDAKNVERPDVSALMMMNTLIPYLSPEDQRNVAAQLYTTAADAFSAYKGEKTGNAIPQNIENILASTQSGLTSVDPAYFTSQERVMDALKALSNMREATVQGNRWKLGPGYTWLQNVATTTGKYGGVGGGRMSRVQEQALMGALDPLLAAGGQGEIGPLAAVGRMLATPFFSQDQLFKKRQTQTGQTFLGGISPYLFA